jgi:hypothetical protein
VPGATLGGVGGRMRGIGDPCGTRFPVTGTSGRWAAAGWASKIAAGMSSAAVMRGQGRGQERDKGEIIKIPRAFCPSCGRSAETILKENNGFLWTIAIRCKIDTKMTER